MRGRRPHLILTRDSAIPVVSALVGVPATRTVRGIPTEVPLGREDGMLEPCALTLDNVCGVRRAYFLERICALAVAAACDA
jgi:mRNA interferase MazF